MPEGKWQYFRAEAIAEYPGLKVFVRYADRYSIDYPDNKDIGAGIREPVFCVL